MIVGSSFTDNTLFSEATLLHENNSEIRDARFQTYYQGLEGRIQKELEVNILIHADSALFLIFVCLLSLIKAIQG